MRMNQGESWHMGLYGYWGPGRQRAALFHTRSRSFLLGIVLDIHSLPKACGGKSCCKIWRMELYGHRRTSRYEWFEQTYAKPLIPRVCSKVQCPQAQNDQKHFRDDVLGSYKAISGTQACCFASGRWFFKAEIKVAHHIPNAMTADEIFYLIGDREDMLRDP